MSNRFVSGGTIGDGAPEGGGEEAPAPAAGRNAAQWEAVQKELDEERQRREEQRRKAMTGEEKSLYEILQENKAAKQAAFEEQTKVRNQFRALDDDEIDFLDEVRERKRVEEERARRELEEGLRAFREARKGEERVEGEADPERGAAVEGESWGVGRKRKRKGKEVRGIVRRRVSEGGGEHAEADKDDHGDGGSDGGEEADKKGAAEGDEGKAGGQAGGVKQEQQERTGKASLGLVDYGSDDSD